MSVARHMNVVISLSSAAALLFGAAAPAVAATLDAQTRQALIDAIKLEHTCRRFNGVSNPNGTSPT